MKIPKILFQISDLRPAKYLKEQMKEACDDWSYINFLESDIINYINNNPIPEFENSLEKFKNGSTVYKTSFFKYFFLYINGGVYLNSQCMVEKNITKSIEKCSFFAVQSCIKMDSLFNGFIGCESKNQIIYEALKDIYQLDQEKLKENFDLPLQNLHKIVENYKLVVKKEEIYIFSEKIEGNESNIKNEMDEIILKHYFKNDCIPSKTTLEKIQKPIHETKIGITFAFPSSIGQLFNNGIRQNNLYFAELLLNIGYKCYFICEDKLVGDNELVKNVLYDERFKIVKHSEILFFDFDIVFIF